MGAEVEKVGDDSCAARPRQMRVESMLQGVVKESSRSRPRRRQRSHEWCAREFALKSRREPPMSIGGVGCSRFVLSPLRSLRMAKRRKKKAGKKKAGRKKAGRRKARR